MTSTGLTSLVLDAEDMTESALNDLFPAPDGTRSRGGAKRQIVAGLMVTADGIYEGQDRWSLRYLSPEFSRAIGGLMLAGDAMLMGRRTYEMMRDEYAHSVGFTADLMNRRPKYVVSSLLEATNWENSLIIRPDQLEEALNALKDGRGGNLNVTGSVQLVRTLLQVGLLDRLHLFVFPVHLNRGEQFLPALASEAGLPLRATRTLPNGIVELVYGRLLQRLEQTTS